MTEAARGAGAGGGRTTAAPPRKRRLSAPIGMAAGLLLVGLSGYVFLAVTGHSPSASDAAALSSLYFLVGLVTLGVFMGLEQETSRATSRAAAEGRPLAPVARTAQRHALSLLAATNVILLAASPLLVNGPLRGNWWLLLALIVGTVSASGVYLVRGRLGGQQQFVGYSATLATEGLARLIPCVLIFLGFRSSSGAAAAYGFAFTVALSFAALVGLRWLRKGSGTAATCLPCEEGIGTVNASVMATNDGGELDPHVRHDLETLDARHALEARSSADAAPDAHAGRLSSDFEAHSGHTPATEASEFASGERSAAGGLLFLVAASMLTQLVANLPPLVASSRLTRADALAAAFGQAFVLVRIPLLLTSPIQAMLLPALTRNAATGDHAALRQKVWQGLAAVLALGFVGTTALAVAGPWVLKVFFGTKSTLSHELLGALGVGTVFLMLTAILQPTLVALNRHRLVPVAWGVGAALLTIVVILPIDPVHAAAAGSVAGPLAVVAVMLYALADALRRSGARPAPSPRPRSTRAPALSPSSPRVPPPPSP